MRMMLTATSSGTQFGITALPCYTSFCSVTPGTPLRTHATGLLPVARGECCDGASGIATIDPASEREEVVPRVSEDSVGLVGAPWVPPRFGFIRRGRENA